MNSLNLLLRNQWRVMLAINLAIIVGRFFYKAFVEGKANFQYLHLIIDYQFGFAKRAFMGTLVSVFLPTVPTWFVFVLGGAVILAAILLFLVVFKRTFGLTESSLPLLIFVFGSPFFFKNFVKAVGYFDVYGCIFALIVLLVPARSFFYVVFASLGCIVLVLIHHLHFLLYVPTIGVIVAIRYYFVRGITPFNFIGGATMIAAIAGTFLLAQFYGNVPVSMPVLIEYLKTRVADPGYFLNPVTIEVWYRPLLNDMRSTRFVLWQNLTRVPVYVALVALHWPLIEYFIGLIRSRANALHRKLIVTAITLVSVGYLPIFVVVFDYARWVSGWAVCMFLIMFAAGRLPAAREPAPIAADNNRNRILGWILSAIPHVGVTRPL